MKRPRGNRSKTHGVISGDLDQDGAVPDYRDGRDIRAFTPVFDGLLPSHDQVGTVTRFAADMSRA
jgi:hypothetical protein